MPKLAIEDLPEEALYKMVDRNSASVAGLMSYLSDEHSKALSAYQEYFEELRKFRRAIAAQPNVRVKTFPWPGASNMVVPLIRVAGDAIKARVVNTLLAPKPFWVCSSPSTTYADFAQPAEKLLEWALKNDIPIVDTIYGIADQVVYLGKCPVKVSWREVVKKIRTYHRTTRKVVHYTRTVEDNPCIEPILLENWLEPWGIEPPEKKPWNSHRVFLRLGDVVERAKQGLIYADVEKIKESVMENIPSDLVQASEDRKISWAFTEIAPLYETYVDYDLDGDGFREQLIVLWHYVTSTPLSIRYNFLFHGFRPIETLFYLRHGDSRASGDGIAQLLFQLQEGLSSFVNQRSDNITIANTKFWKGRKGVVKAGAEIWPGKIMLLDEPQTDLVGEQLGTVSPVSFQHESIIRDYAERLSGIADPQLGREFDNPRVAATTTLSILQEGNRRFDMVVRLLREGLGRIGLRVLQLYQQFEPRVPLEQIVSPEEAVFLRQLLDMPAEEIEKSMVVQVNTSSASVNKETERQGLIALNQLIIGFYANVISITRDVIANPQVPGELKDMVIEMAQASYNTIKEIVQSYDIANVEKFLVDVAESMRLVRGGASVESIEGGFNQGLSSFARLVGNRNGGSTPPDGGALAEAQGAAAGGGAVRANLGGGATQITENLGAGTGPSGI